MKIKFISYAFKHKRLYIISLLGLVLSVGFALLGPFLMGKLIDSVIAEGKSGLFWYLAIAMGLSYAFTGVFRYIEEYHSDLITKGVAADIRKDLFSWVQKQDGAFFRRRTPADLMSRTTTDANNIGFSFGFCGIYTLEIIGTVIAMTIAILFVNPVGVLVPLILMPCIAVLAFIAETRGDKVMDEISDENANINQVASEAIRGIRTVKAFGKEEEEKVKLHVHNKRFRCLNDKVDFIWADWYAPVEAISRSMVLLNVLLCGILVIDSKLSLGELSTIFQYTSQLSLPIMDLGWLLRTFAQARSGARKINAIMEHEPKIIGGDGDGDLSLSTIEFKNVSFVVEGKKLLEDISFTLAKGKSLAIMGATGSGKSLIASLAVRFLDCTDGEILIDGENVKKLPIDYVRRFSSIVTQDIFLFSDSVLDNIRLGQKRFIAREKCIDSAKKAKASGFIENLSNGYETIIGERGVGLSGGQRQRLSIARAFSKDSRLMILDDATSALDMETEKEIERTLLSEKDRSLLIIAHRISAVAFADEILVLDEGRIVERGSHKELLAKRGKYYQTYTSQYPKE